MATQGRQDDLGLASLLAPAAIDDTHDSGLSAQLLYARVVHARADRPVVIGVTLTSPVSCTCSKPHTPPHTTAQGSWSSQYSIGFLWQGCQQRFTSLLAPVTKRMTHTGS